jgi:hypothetical protein
VNATRTLVEAAELRLVFDLIAEIKNRKTFTTYLLA